MRMDPAAAPSAPSLLPPTVDLTTGTATACGSGGSGAG
jgi:hypothetical protein